MSQLAIVFGSATKPSRFAPFWQGAQSLETTSQRPKVLRTPQFFALLTSKCASCHNSVHFFDIATSKSALNLVCFVHSDLEMCFAPQRHALFGHLNFQKWSKHEVFCTCGLGKMLRASSLIWPDGSAPATLASLLFDPPEPQFIGKTQSFATFLPFCAPASSFFWFFLFSDLLSSSLLFSSLTLPTCAFPSAHIVGSLTSKLPSIISLITNYGPLWIHFKHQSNISKSIDFIWPSRPTLICCENIDPISEQMIQHGDFHLKLRWNMCISQIGTAIACPGLLWKPRGPQWKGASWWKQGKNADMFSASIRDRNEQLHQSISNLPWKNHHNHVFNLYNSV